MTFDASRLIVLATTAPHPSSNALPITFAFVPGGPEPITNGLGSFRPLTVVSSVAMTNSDLESRCRLPQVRVAVHQDRVQEKSDGEGDEPCVSVEGLEEIGHDDLAAR